MRTHHFDGASSGRRRAGAASGLAVGVGDPLYSFELTYPRETGAAWASGDEQFALFTQFPDLFDASDLEHAVSQPSAHVAEWFAAIEFHRRHFEVLIEKYTIPGKHPRAFQRASDVLGDKQIRLLAGNTGLAPDLLVFNEKLRFFVEVKRGPDTLKDQQRTLFTQLRLLYGMPWFLASVHEGPKAVGLADQDMDAMLKLAEANPTLGSDPSPRRFPRSDLRTLPVGATRDIRCHQSADQHPKHATTKHNKVEPNAWRCELCGAAKTHQTKAEIVAEIQRLKELAWAGGLNNRIADRARRATVTPEIREGKRESERLAKDHIDLNWFV